MQYLKVHTIQKSVEGSGVEQSKVRDGMLALTGIAVGLATLALIPSQIQGQTLGAIADPTSSAFFPILAALALIACCTLLLMLAMTRSDTNAERAGPLLTLRSVGTSALLAAYLMMIHLVGMFIATPLMIIGLSLAFGYRNWPFVIGSAVVMPLLIWLLFQKILVVVFPSGVLF